MNKKTFFLSIACIWIPILGHNATKWHNNLWANYQHYSGKFSDAQQWYHKLFSSHNCIHSCKGYITLLSDTKQYDRILALMPILDKKPIKDPDIQLIFVNALQATKHIQKADALVIELSQSFKTHSEIALLAAQAYLRRQETENALLTIDAYLNNTPRRPNNFIFYFLQSHIYAQLNQLPQALQSTQKCLEMHPHFDKAWLLHASLSEKEGKIKDAIAGYTHFLELTGKNNLIEQQLLKLESQLSTSDRTNRALILFKQKRYSQALVAINEYLTQQPHNDEYKLLKIQILSAMNNFTDAACCLSMWIMHDPDNSIWHKTLCLLAHNGMPYQIIIETFNAILKKQPDNLWCHLYSADICMRTEQNHCAITHLEKALLLIKDNSLAAKIAHQLALLHYNNNNYAAMHIHLEKAYTYNSDCAHTNNSLAYYWATKGKDLAKAHQCIEKSLQSNSANPHFLDTKALILYKEKKYEQAQEILEKLTGFQNGTMLLHLAKVHYALKNNDFADDYTKKAEAIVKTNHEKKALIKMKLLLAQQ